ncbi:SDR family oxidoreductase [Shewanella indica]|uniref:SDR family NAD(P)-dependent oxidoreductase n=1 Tax=Shewanella indica TaxID=768528 RepID=UPI001F3B5C54|nr:SDR family oxidoreductase [Shewanella indica]MCE9793800.1 SDR family oxidoreductase [Shewanella indica]
MTSNMLSGKTILITGASSGIGRATAEFFSQQGAKLIIAGRNLERLNATLENLYGKNHISFSVDLTSSDGVKLLMDEVFEMVGALDGIVHCAGVMKTLPLQALKEKDFDDIFNLNVKSAQFICKYLRRKNRFNSNGSSVVFLSSVAASCGEPANTTYAASKAALEGLTKSLAMELSTLKIRVNSLAPGLVKTEMYIDFSKQLTESQMLNIENKHPLGLGEPSDIAHAAAFLISDLSRWVTGTTLFVDGGYSAH